MIIACIKSKKPQKNEYADIFKNIHKNLYNMHVFMYKMIYRMCINDIL